MSGTVTEVKARRVCVTDRDGARSCARADTPERLLNTVAGDCVRLRLSAEDVLISIEPASDGCATP